METQDYSIMNDDEKRDLILYLIERICKYNELSFLPILSSIIESQLNHKNKDNFNYMSCIKNIIENNNYNLDINLLINKYKNITIK